MIFIIQNTIPHYRKAFYNELAKHFEVTVLHSGSRTSVADDRYNERILVATKIGPLYFQRHLVDAIRRTRPDAVIAMCDIRWLSIVRAMYTFDRHLPWIWWGLDEGASSWAFKVKLRIAERPNPIVFYSTHSLERCARAGVDRGKLFVANNTFHVPTRTRAYRHPTKSTFINVGSLDSRKDNATTIRVFKRVLAASGLDLQYILIGDGPERDALQQLITSEGLTGSVVLAGQMNDPESLCAYYQEALASVSYGQAGLAVLQSFAFGVPFVTKADAISGGEKHNIRTGINGWLCSEDPRTLEAAMLRFANDPQWARQLGKNAFDYYSTHCTIENMVNGFLLALSSKAVYGHHSY
jgi:glycosyltransferase involved in cell wall biosynthesis